MKDLTPWQKSHCNNRITVIRLGSTRLPYSFAVVLVALGVLFSDLSWADRSGISEHISRPPIAGCPAARPIFFDGQCRGKQFFSQFAIPGFELLEVIGCTDRPVGDPGSCGRSIAITESNNRRLIRTLTIRSARVDPTQVSKQDTPGTLDRATGERSGYRVSSRIDTQVRVFPSGTQSVTITHAVNTTIGLPQKLSRQRLIMSDMTSTSSSFNYQISMEICANVTLPALAEHVPGKPLKCNRGKCEYREEKTTPTPNGAMVTDLRVIFPVRLGMDKSDKTQVASMDGFGECATGTGTYSGYFNIPYTSAYGAGACGPAIASLPGQTCRLVGGVVGAVAAGVSAPVLQLEFEIGLPSGVTATGIGGRPLSIGNLLLAPGRAAFEGYQVANDACGMIFGDIVGVELIDLLCGLDDYTGGGCEGTHTRVPVILTSNDGRRCQGTADLSCTSSRSGAKLGDSDCQCVASNQAVTDGTCQ